MHAVREFLNNIHTLCRTERRQNFLVRGIRLAHADIVKNAALDEMAVLEHKGNGVHQLIFVDVLYVDAADGNATTLRVEEAGDQCRQRGFAAARGSDKCHRLTRTDRERNILQGILCAVVAEGDMIQRYRTVPGLLRYFRLRKRRTFQYAVNTGDGILHDHSVLAHKHQLGHCHRDDRCDNDVKEQIQQHAAIRAAAREQEASCD